MKKLIKYSCGNPYCNNKLEDFPSQIGHKKYCSAKCRKEHKLVIANEKQKDFVICKCRDCGHDVKTYRQMCGNLIPRKLCNDCHKKLRRNICKNMTIKELEKQVLDKEYRQWKLNHMRIMNKLACTNKVIKKIRLTTLKNIKNRHGQIMPNYNPSSIPILEAKAKELGITDLQHAENGGEFNIKELGYWVDGYSKEKNIVLEHYEKWHNRQKEKDVHRKEEIISFLNCDFVEIHELETA